MAGVVASDRLLLQLLPKGLQAELITLSHGERECSRACATDLAHRIRPFEHIGGIPPVIAAALGGQSEKFHRHLDWQRVLRSNLPIWRLLVKSGLPVEEPRRDDFHALMGRLSMSVNGWATNMRRLRGCRRTGPTGDTWPEFCRGFADFLKQVHRWPSLAMQTEMLVMAAIALRQSIFFHLTMQDTDPAPDLVLQAELHFLGLAQQRAKNVTYTGAMHISPRLLGLLEYNEALRLNYDFASLIPFLPARPTIVFAGAHTGTVFRNVVGIWPTGQIHGFEPDPFFFVELQKNLPRFPESRTGNVYLHNKALSLQDGETKTLLTRNGTGSQSSLYEPTEFAKEKYGAYASLSEGTTFRLRTVALREWASRWRVPAVDFIYLDVECSELDVLQGAGRLLANTSVLHLEVSNAEYCQGGRLWSDVEGFLQRQGFRTLVLPKRPWSDIMDIRAVRTSFLGDESRSRLGFTEV